MNSATVLPVVARQEGSGFHSHSVCVLLLPEPLWVFCGLLMCVWVGVDKMAYVVVLHASNNVCEVRLSSVVS